VEQWFSFFPRKRLYMDDFESTAHLQAKIEQFIHAWNQPCMESAQTSLQLVWQQQRPRRADLWEQATNVSFSENAIK